MRYRSRNCIPNMIEELMDDHVKHGQVLLIRYYGAMDLYKELLVKDHLENQQVILKYHKFSEADMTEPYEPFLSWLRDEIREHVVDLNGFFDEMDVFISHRPVFSSYINDEYARRKEGIWEDDVDFEKQRMQESIKKMLIRFSKDRPILFILDKLHCAQLSTIKFLDYLLDGNDLNKVSILAGYNENYLIDQYAFHDWTNLTKKAINKECLMDIETTHVRKTEIKIEFQFYLEKIKEYLIFLNNKAEFLEFEEAEYYLEIIYGKLNHENMEVSPRYEFLIYLLYAEIYKVSKRYRESMLMCERMKKVTEKEYHLEYEYWYKFILAKIQDINALTENARRNMADAMDLAVEMNNDRLIVMSRSMYLIMLRAKLDEPYTTCDIEVDSLLEKMEAYEQFNNMTLLLAFEACHDENLYESVENLYIEGSYAKRSLDLAKWTGNKTMQMGVYNIYVHKASKLGKFDILEHLYDKALEVVGKDTMEAAYTYMGLGHNLCVNEKYEKAQEYLCKALSICHEKRDMNHGAEVFYNMAVNSILAEDYDTAKEYVNAAIWIMKEMSYVQLYACDITNLYELKAIIHYKMGKIYLCELELNKIKRHIDFSADNKIRELYRKDLFFYHYIKGLLLLEEKEYKKAEVSFGQANRFMQMDKGIMFYTFIWLSAARARLFEELGKEDLRKEQIQNVVDYCDANGFHLKKEQFLRQVNHLKYPLLENTMPQCKIKIEDVFYVVETEKMRKQLSERQKERKFLEKWQKVMGRTDNSVDDLISESLSNFMYHYGVTQLLFLRIKENQNEIITRNMDFMIPKKNVDAIIGKFQEGMREFVTTVDDKNYDEYKDLIRLIGCKKIYSIFGAPFKRNGKTEYIIIGYNFLGDLRRAFEAVNCKVLEKDELGVYTRLFRQMIDTIERFENNKKVEEMNYKLRYFAQTDALTDLYNRKGLYEKIEERLRENQESNENKSYSILYLDMDNFKIYNDSFGHDIGDMVLRQFAFILRDLTRGIGLAVRYGGDEFVLILNDYLKEHIIRIVNHIYDRLSKEDYFQKMISRELNREIYILKENRISFSVGISEFCLHEDSTLRDFEIALDHADKALYRAKDEDKGKFVFFDDLHG